MNEEATEVTVTVKGVITLPQLDVQKYIGRKAKIESVKVFKGNFGYYMVASTSIIDANPVDKAGKTVLNKEGKTLELRATRLFGLQVDENANIGWGAETKTGVFMSKMGITDPQRLIGKEVIVQTITKKEDGKDYLTFN